MSFLEIFVAGPYSVMLTAAVVVGLALAIRTGNQAGFAPLAWRVVLAAALTGGLIGSTLIFLDFHSPQYGEKSNLGGIIAGIIIVVTLARWLHIGALRALDGLSVPTLVGMAIGRVGCFLAGCCAGTHTALPWGVHVDGDAEAIHPVQLYEMFADLLIVGLLTRFVPLSKPGQRIGVAVVSYAGVRFAAEFVRAGRTSTAGLNPVQWSLLAIGAVVVLWLARRRSAPSATTIPVFSERRTHLAAMLVTGVLISVTFGISPAFAPFERVLFMAAAMLIAGYAILRDSSQWLRQPLVPSLGALFVFSAQSDSIPPQRDIIVGGGIWSGAYSTIVGDTPYEGYDCNNQLVSRSRPTYARRHSTTGWFSAGVRQRTQAGRRVTIEGQLLTGKDKVKSLDAGNLFAPVDYNAKVMAGGASVTVEGVNQDVRLNVLSGQLSKSGTESHSVTGSLLARTGVESGVFLEGSLAPRQWYANTGEFSYAGVGYVTKYQRARIMIGAGDGAIGAIHIPADRFEFDLVGRIPSSFTDIVSPQPTLSIGIKTVFPLR